MFSITTNSLNTKKSVDAAEYNKVLIVFDFPMKDNSYLILGKNTS